MKYVPTDRREVLTKALLRSADELGLTTEELAQVLGVTPATIARMTSNEYVLDENRKEWELAALLVRLYQGLAAMLLDNETNVRNWMRQPNTGLRTIPVECIITITGLAETVSYVEASQVRS